MDEILAAGLTLPAWIFSMVVVLAAAIVRGYSGFGFSALLVTTLALVMTPAEVVPIALMLEVAASVHMLPKVWREVDRKLVGWLLAGAIIASPVGVSLLASLPANPMRITLYIICLAAVGIIWRGYKAPDGHGTGRVFGAGLISGVVNGATAMGGLMVVIFMLTGSLSAAAMRASLIAFFLILDSLAALMAGYEGLLSPDTLTRTAIFLPILVLGNMLGHRKFVASAPESFKRFTLILLMVISISGLVWTLIKM